MKTSDWRKAWEESGDALKPWHRRVLSALANSMGGNGGQEPTRCEPSYPRLGLRSGYKPARVKEIVRELDAIGWINVAKRRGLRNRYYAVVPAAPKRSACPYCESTDFVESVQGGDFQCLTCHSEWSDN